jgi:hypothetical protein
VSLAPFEKPGFLTNLSVGKENYNRNPVSGGMGAGGAGGDDLSGECPWTIGVQWHPERSPKCSVNSRIFRSFVQAAASKFMTYTKSA